MTAHLAWVFACDRRDHLGGFEDFKPNEVVSTVTSKNPNEMSGQPVTSGHYNKAIVLRASTQKPLQLLAFGTRHAMPAKADA